MALNDNNQKQEKGKRKRPGVPAKNKNGRNKGSKHYKKAYRGQGR
jgi:hypothetical protein